MNDDRVRELLRELPRVEASPSFNRRLFDRVDRGDSAPFRSHRLAWTALATVIAIGVVGAGVWRVERVRAAQADRAELAALRSEQRAIADELRRLKDLNEGAGQVFLGGDDRVEFVMDLTRPRRAPRAQPAAFRAPMQPEP